MLKSALLFYQKLVEDLKKIGCEVNPYDPSVINKNVGGSQLTITWHVDYLKVPHKDQSEVKKIVEYLQGIYGDQMTVRRGKVHDYLGMTLDYSEKGVLKVSMIP